MGSLERRGQHAGVTEHSPFTGALFELGRAILRTRDRDALFQTICSKLVEVACVRSAAIHLLAVGSGRTLVANAGSGAGALLELEFALPVEPRSPAREQYGQGRSANFQAREQNEDVGAVLTLVTDTPLAAHERALLGALLADTTYALGEISRDEARDRTAQISEAAERERRFSNALIESIPGILYLYDIEGRFLRFNDNFVRVSGYSAGEITQMHPLDFFSGEEKRLLSDKIGEVFATGKGFVEANFMSKDGHGTPYFFTGRSIVLDGATCLVGMGIDITERRRAEEALARSEERYRTTLDNIIEGCQLLDFGFHYLYLNDAAAIHNRRPNAELTGKTMMEAWPGIEATSAFAMLRRSLEERVAVHQEVEFAFPDGSRGWFDVRSQPVPEGVFVLSIDISARKHAEDERNRLERMKKQELEGMVSVRTAELEAALLRAEAADRLKSAFLATMSHELRTPLNSIIGFTGVLMQGLAGPLTGEQTKQLGMVSGSARHLLELINDVLDISKIEAGELSLSVAAFDLRECLQRVIDTVQPMAHEQRLTLRLEHPPALGSMTGDRRRVAQILLNLVHNAIKFTDHGSVTLRATLLPAEDSTPDRLRLQVIDTGIGIKPDGLAVLFQPFRQLDRGVSRRHEGTGLGLAICARLTALMGGQIVAESEWEKGSAFTVTLPLSTPFPTLGGRASTRAT